jgi:N-acetylneuraminate synthase/sialic acid synthase
MIISTGGATLDDVDRAVETVLAINRQLCVMQCTSAYPADYAELDLGVIQTFRERYPEVVIGYSGHDNSISMPVVAYMLGARVIEKHFTLNRVMKGTDHIFSLEPPGLRRVVRDLQRARVAIGDGVKKRRPTEFAPMVKMAKSLYAARPLRAGQVLTEADLAIKCPGGGMPPYELENVIGRTLLVDLAEEDALAFDNLTPIGSDVQTGADVGRR